MNPQLLEQWADGHRLSASYALPVDLRATVRFQTRDFGESIKVLMHGAIVTHEPVHRLLLPEDANGSGKPPPTPLPAQLAMVGDRSFDVEAITSDELARAKPSVWIQMIDERGAALVRQDFLGPGVDVAYPVRARFTVPVTIQVSAGSAVAARARDVRPARIGLDVRLRYGLYAGLLFRTPSDRPRQCPRVESCLMPLLSAGDRFRCPELRVPAAPGSTGWGPIASFIGRQMLGKAGW